MKIIHIIYMTWTSAVAIFMPFVHLAVAFAAAARDTCSRS